MRFGRTLRQLGLSRSSGLNCRCPMRRSPGELSNCERMVAPLKKSTRCLVKAWARPHSFYIVVGSEWTARFETRQTTPHATTAPVNIDISAVDGMPILRSLRFEQLSLRGIVDAHH